MLDLILKLDYSYLLQYFERPTIQLFIFFVDIIFAVIGTLLIEVPYVRFVMKYENIKGICLINILTNITLNTFVFIFMYFGQVFNFYKDSIILIFKLILFGLELLAIPIIESLYYIKTNVYFISRKRIWINTYIANLLSFLFGVFVYVSILSGNSVIYGIKYLLFLLWIGG